MGKRETLPTGPIEKRDAVQRYGHHPNKYVEIFNKFNVTRVIRLNEEKYDIFETASGFMWIEDRQMPLRASRGVATSSRVSGVGRNSWRMVSGSGRRARLSPVMWKTHRR